MRHALWVVLLLSLWSACDPPARDERAPPAPSAPPAATSANYDEADDAPAEALPAPADQLADQAADGPCASAERCNAEAVSFERARKLGQAAPLYARACDLGDGAACHRLGELHQAGKGVKLDDGRARQLFEQGCQLGSTSACDALGH
jgi:hypothetical protein